MSFILLLQNNKQNFRATSAKIQEEKVKTEMCKNVMLRFKLVFDKDSLDRVHACLQDNGALQIVADLHHLTKSRAKHFLKNIIALVRCSFSLLVIHGYTHGTVLREMVRNEDISNRIFAVAPVPYDKGQTILEVK